MVGSTRYFAGVWERINSPDHKKYNPNYKFSLERLEQFKESITIILGTKAKKSLQLLNKYKKANSDLKEYKNQQYTIKNPNFFKNLNTAEQLYWFGFLCADGWLVRGDIKKYYRIGIELSKKDRDRLELFGKLVGFPLNRIKGRVKYTKDTSGNLNANKMSYIVFGCKPMFKDLIKYGLTYSKLQQLPAIINNFIDKAKIELSQGKFTSYEIDSFKLLDSKHWYYTPSGRVTLAWLLGYYDGDGHYMGGKSATISSSNESLLKQIKNSFMIKNPVRKYKYSKSLSLGPKLFEAMILSYKNSMKRKRPPDQT